MDDVERGPMSVGTIEEQRLLMYDFAENHSLPIETRKIAHVLGMLLGRETASDRFLTRLMKHHPELFG